MFCFIFDNEIKNDVFYLQRVYGNNKNCFLNIIFPIQNIYKYTLELIVISTWDTRCTSI